ncbi:hypothetical protein OEZ85_008775 [Tetradesmus obliquus]|uniref:Uncharacterized protein n=1 Tax=Tetradesmus obliquus TaxID=3088 RepID=A0ABY8TJS8_TETOB|nr:hypothetical protein OEZ85_008775 [Tetradesmus obliquus]
MGIGVYFGLLRPAPGDPAKDQAATAFAVAQLYDVADSPGTADAAAVGAVPPMNFQVVLAVPAVSADQGCSTWFSSAERLQQYKAIFAASYTAALKQPVHEGSISAITCGGTLIYKAYTSAAAPTPSASAAAVPEVSTPANLAEATARVAAASNGAPTAPMQPAAADRAAAAAMPTRTLLAHAGFGAIHNSWASQRSLLQQQQRRNVLSLVEVVTRFRLPAPASHAERTAIAESVVTGSSAILSGPMSEFFKVPSALMNFVPWSNNNNNNNNADNLYKADSQEAALLPAPGRARAAVPMMQPRLSYAEAPTCLFPLTRSNSMADDQGRFWSLMDGQECVFRPAAAAIPRPVARFVSWEDAPACEEQPSESNSVADDSGRLWGWQAGASCAFKNEEAAASAAKGDAARVAAPDAAAAAAEASRVSVVWEAAPSCSFSPNKGNAVPDTYGRLWSWENGRSCAFRWQSLPARRL